MLIDDRLFIWQCRLALLSGLRCLYWQREVTQSDSFHKCVIGLPGLLAEF